MPRSRTSRSSLKLVPKKPTLAFDAGLDQVCRSAADDVARELGRQAALEAIEQMTRKKEQAS